MSDILYVAIGGDEPHLACYHIATDGSLLTSQRFFGPLSPIHLTWIILLVANKGH